MTETVNDTETFTMTLTTIEPAVTCTGKSPHYGTGCALLKHYDPDGDGKITLDGEYAAIDDYRAGKITRAEYDFVEAAWNAGGLIDAKCAGCYIPLVAPAQGKIEKLDYPTSVNHGANVKIAFNIHNIGAESGNFVARVYENGGTRGDWIAVVNGGGILDGAITVKAPSSGTSVSYTLKLSLKT